MFRNCSLKLTENMQFVDKKCGHVTIPTPDDDPPSVNVCVGKTSAGKSLGGKTSAGIFFGGDSSAGKYFGGDSSVWSVFPGGDPSVGKLFGSNMTLVCSVVCLN